MAGTTPTICGRRSPGRWAWSTRTSVFRRCASTGSPSSMPPTGPTRGGWTLCASCSALALHRATVPGASGVSTARDMARFYAAIAAGGALAGVRILRPETVARMLAVEVDGEIDQTFNVPVRRGLGLRARRADRSTTALARCNEHRAHLLARWLRLLRLLGRRRLCDWRWPS